MSTLALHTITVGIILGAPALDRWMQRRYDLSTRWCR